MHVTLLRYLLINAAAHAPYYAQTAQCTLKHSAHSSTVHTHAGHTRWATRACTARLSARDGALILTAPCWGPVRCTQPTTPVAAVRGFAFECALRQLPSASAPSAVLPPPKWAQQDIESDRHIKMGHTGAFSALPLFDALRTAGVPMADSTTVLRRHRRPYQPSRATISLEKP